MPQGVWTEFATRRGDAEIVYEKNGDRWTMILENGDSYTGETKNSASVTKFISIQNKIFKCWFVLFIVFESKFKFVDYASANSSCDKV